jgi:hypothetical protein
MRLRGGHGAEPLRDIDAEVLPELAERRML